MIDPERVELNKPPLVHLHQLAPTRARHATGGNTAAVALVVDDLLAWLVTLVADAGRRKLIARVLGTDQERALRPAVEAAAKFRQ
jgi:hypothetical protein